MIFLTITGSWTAAIVYDRREKKRVQQKWCDAVAHLARETLPTNQMQRRLTIYLEAPPADGLMGAREHFQEYVKPILVAAAMDWDAVEGRREGDVRAALAERIRKLRKTRGETGGSGEPLDAADDAETTLAQARLRAGVREWDGPQGDIVIGRNTWKEYVRGLHEGWLGPLDAPPAPPADETPAPPADDASPTDTPADGEQEKKEEEKKEEEPAKPTKRPQPPPFIPATPTAYASAQLSPNCPDTLGPSAPVAYPHILGFLNTPVRMYRFLTRRHLADQIGAQVAAAVLAAGDAPYAAASGLEEEEGSVQAVLEVEEGEWHKTVKKEGVRKMEEGVESLWCDGVVVDERVAGRMRRFVLSEADKARAGRIASGVEGVLGERAEKEE